ncbi:MAG: UvrD-helicase domain-containing protein [Proteobacteria bacterium]|nr:UvrD-helicase domain-containing protein [Pseudomonadota bacterium]
MDLQTLNAPQRAAVLHDSGPLLVLAGAGSGKTRVITYRIARVVSGGVDPARVMAVTFTNKAAGELRQRAAQLVGQGARTAWIGTFHAICARLLRQHGQAIGLPASFQIYDGADQRALVVQVMREISLPERLFVPAEVLGRIDRAKNEGIGPRDFRGGDFFGDVVAKVYPAYERRLQAANAVDFGGLLLRTLELLRQETTLAEALAERFVHLLVDEFQDTNHVQYELVRLLSGRHRNLCVVGDDDQSIYSWRGADIRNILDFERDHADAAVVTLEQNYRSTQTILDAASAIIARNSERRPKRLFTAAGPGAPIIYAPCEDERSEAAFVAHAIARLRQEEGLPYDQCAVFYRTHAQSRVLEEALRARRPAIPHVVVGGVRFYDRAEIKDVLAYLRLLANPTDDLALQRIINEPPRGIGSATLAKISEQARLDGSSALAAARACATGTGELSSGPRAKLAAFCTLIDELSAAAATLPPSALAELVLERSGYGARLASDPGPDGEARAENLLELIGSLRAYEAQSEAPSLPGFLEQAALAGDLDETPEEHGAVTLMTVHGAKGLEFAHVFIVGLERGVFPHARSLDDPQQLEEERRLAYVAVTRARQRLYLCHARRRWLFGQQQVNAPSEFLTDVPRRLLQTESAFSGHAAAVTPRGAFDRSGVRGAARGATRPAGARGGGDQAEERWVDSDEDFDQSAGASDELTTNFRIGMRVRHAKFGVGSIRMIGGTPPHLNLTIHFGEVGPRTIRSEFVLPL